MAEYFLLLLIEWRLGEISDDLTSPLGVDEDIVDIDVVIIVRVSLDEVHGVRHPIVGDESLTLVHEYINVM